MENLIIIGILGIIFTLSIGYVIRAKKRGVKCIGCSCAKSCSGSCACNVENISLKVDI